jgi:hypothetical protein
MATVPLDGLVVRQAAQKGITMIREQDMNEKQRELYETMSDISEDCYCAGWYMSNEYHIWSALQDGDRRYGMGEMDAEQLDKCRTLAEELNGWVIWFDDDDDATLPVEEWGPRFVAMDKWLEKLTHN